ncbi:metal-dependent hydrolase [Hyphococcus sp.]|uniref:metal-dependent hydrolase n=1 Tax=Hyphococcus sp. TaxID=2038636 RepID=UPI003D0BD0F8
MNSADISRSITISPRDQHFAFSTIKERDWLGGDPFRSLVFNGLSITFPAGERFFIRSVKAFRGDIRNETLQSQAGAFMAQEAMHTREHVRYNQRLEEHGCRASMLHEETEARFEWAQTRYSDIEHLAATCALEHFTAILAEELLSKPDLLADARREYRDIWLWHAIEESEHKGVAFDVYQEVMQGKGYWLRVRTMLIVTVLFLQHMGRIFTVLLQDIGQNRSMSARLRLNWALWGKPGLFRKVMLNWAAYFKPGFHPWDHDNRTKLKEAEQFLVYAA